MKKKTLVKTKGKTIGGDADDAAKTKQTEPEFFWPYWPPKFLKAFPDYKPVKPKNPIPAEETMRALAPENKGTIKKRGKTVEVLRGGGRVQRIEWTMEWFYKDDSVDDSLQGETALTNITHKKLQKIFGLMKNEPFIGFYPVKTKHVAALQKHTDVKISLKKYAYFVGGYVVD